MTYIRTVVTCGKILSTFYNSNFNVLNRLLFVASIRLNYIFFESTLAKDHVFVDNAKTRIVGLQKLFGWSENETMEILKKNPKLIRNKFSTVTDITSLLQQKGISKLCISNSPWLLLNTLNSVKLKLQYIEQIGIDENSIHLLPMSQSKLKSIIRSMSNRKELKENILGRIQYLSMHLDMDIGKFYDIINSHPWLLIVDFSKIKKIIKMLKEADVSSEMIRKDLWIFRHNEEVMAERIKIIQSIGAPVKTWLLRSTKAIFDKSLIRWKKKVKALGKHDNIIDYLAERLNCSKEYIYFLSEKNPRLVTVHPLKVKEILDFLFEKGFSAQQICSSTRILHYSLETIQQRLKELEELNYQPSALCVLCCTNKLHQNFVMKLKKQQKNL